MNRPPMRDDYGFRWKPRLKIFSDSGKKVSYNPETGIARSYSWWMLSSRLPNGEVMLNTYRYSRTTAVHRYTIEQFFKNNNIKITYKFDCPGGLQNLDSALNHYEKEKRKAFEKLSTPKIRDYTRERTRALIDEYNEKISMIRKLILIDQGRSEPATEGFNEGAVNL